MSVTNQILLGVISSTVATVVVLLTRLTFYKIRDTLPARALFEGIVGSERACLVFVPRMTDLQQQGRFLLPLPRYAVATPQPEFERRQLTPWVNSTSETQSVAILLNVLGRAGKTEDIQLLYVDQDFDKWDAPMFILGGSWKTRRAFETCNPYFSFRDNRFVLEPTGESYLPRTSNQDMGVLQKMVNPSTGFPVWVAMGWRGNGTGAATYALARWWKQLGLIFGRRRFGVLIGMDDRDGGQQCRVLRLYPQPTWRQKLLHPLAWRSLRGVLSADADSWRTDASR